MTSILVFMAFGFIALFCIAIAGACWDLPDGETVGALAGITAREARILYLTCADIMAGVGLIVGLLEGR
uniref:Uncharacterized protein n=1 Tax=viral metagenome TaxID=1070528 RepID=A0A6M3M0N4_9ZZZZ